MKMTLDEIDAQMEKFLARTNEAVLVEEAQETEGLLRGEARCDHGVVFPFAPPSPYGSRVCQEALPPA